jgi:hypothetical protein
VYTKVRQHEVYIWHFAWLWWCSVGPFLHHFSDFGSKGLLLSFDRSMFVVKGICWKQFTGFANAMWPFNVQLQPNFNFSLIISSSLIFLLFCSEFPEYSAGKVIWTIMCAQTYIQVLSPYSTLCYSSLQNGALVYFLFCPGKESDRIRTFNDWQWQASLF